MIWLIYGRLKINYWILPCARRPATKARLFGMYSGKSGNGGGGGGALTAARFFGMYSGIGGIGGGGGGAGESISMNKYRLNERICLVFAKYSYDLANC